MPETINAETGQVENNSPTIRPSIMNPPTVASIINIPPQISTTLFWVGVGFALCWWLTSKRDSSRGFF